MKKLIWILILSILISNLTYFRYALSYSNVTFQKQEYQHHYCWGIWSNGVPGCLVNTTKNTLISKAIAYAGIYNFYYDDWSSIVTYTGGYTDNWSLGDHTEYFDQVSNQYWNIYDRIPYNVWLSPDWILLCAGTANFNIGCTSGYVKGSVMGRFIIPVEFNPNGSPIFTAWTKIDF